MERRTIEIKKGINLHIIKAPKFKTNLLAVFLTTKLSRSAVTKNALISSILRRGSMSMQTQEEISIEMEEMYGASFDVGVNKIGDNQVIKFYLESINDEFLPVDNQDILGEGLKKLFDLVFNPVLENGMFKEEYLNQEKINIKKRIEAKPDDKASYANIRVLEEMYKDKPYGLYRYGYAEDLEKISSKDLYSDYIELINNCKIDIYVSGDVEESVQEKIKSDANIEKLKSREAEFELVLSEEKEAVEEKIVTEKRDVAQGKLMIGMDVNITEEQKEAATVYNAILGGSANSKMFQNVRETAQLAYVAGSNFVKAKNNIIIKTGIDIENYEKALKIVKEQIVDMENGEFTDTDIENAKKVIIDSYESIKDEQDSQITYYYGQELSNTDMDLNEYIKKIKDVNKEDVIGIAKNTKINTIYFLRN